MMKAIFQNGYGDPKEVLSLGEAPRPSPGEDQVLIRVRATSVNTPDWAQTLGEPYLIRLGVAGFGTPKNVIIGTDVAGIVEAVGENVTDFKMGDEVFGSTGDGDFNKEGRGGTFCEYSVAPVDQILKKPPGLSFEEAAGAVMSGITALQTLRDGAKVKSGTSILINGASGGVGTFAVQIAKSMGGTVTGVCSTKNIDHVRSLGADFVIDYTKEDYTESERKYDVILDNVMNRSFKESARALKPDGIVIPNSIGTDRGKWVGAIPSFFFKPKSYPAIESKTNRQSLQDMTEVLESGKVKVVVDKTFSLEEAPDAVAYMASHRARGQVIVSVASK